MGAASPSSAERESDRFVNTLVAEQAHENNGAKKRSWPVRLDQ
jgi:hypothetical protein